MVGSKTIHLAYTGKADKSAVTFWQIGGFKISLGLLSPFSEDELGLLTSHCWVYFKCLSVL